MTTPAGSPGTASDGYRVEKPVGRHRAPPEPPPPPKLLRWLPHVTVLAVVGIVGPPVWLFAVTIGADASAASAAAARDSVAVSTAARSARTVHVPPTILPAPRPTIGASGAWDPETDAPIPNNPVSAPVPSETFAGATGTATAPQTLTGELVATTTPLTTTRPPTTSTVDTATTARITTTPSPSPTAAASTTSSATQTTEATVTPTSSAEPTPTDVIGDVIEDVLEPEPTP